MLAGKCLLSKFSRGVHSQQFRHGQNISSMNPNALAVAIAALIVLLVLVLFVLRVLQVLILLQMLVSFQCCSACTG